MSNMYQKSSGKLALSIPFKKNSIAKKENPAAFLIYKWKRLQG